MPLYLSAPLVFLTTLASAWCWVLYLRYSVARQAFKAALADVAIVALSMVSVVGYTDDHRLAVPILAAAFIGTYCVVRKKP